MPPYMQKNHKTNKKKIIEIWENFKNVVEGSSRIFFIIPSPDFLKHLLAKIQKKIQKLINSTIFQKKKKKSNIPNYKKYKKIVILEAP